jgi:hypothetical protein
MLVSAVFMQQVIAKPAPPTLPFSPAIIVSAEAALFFAVGGWSIMSAIGLLRLKSWARISIMILGGLMAVFGLFGLLAAGFVSFVPLPMPPGQAPPPAQMKAVVGVVMAVFALGQTAIGAWWIIFLSRRTVGEQFRSGAAVASQV